MSGWLDEQLQASPDPLRAMVKTFAEAVMGAEADAVCNAGYRERILVEVWATPCTLSQSARAA